ncbi:MAG TPA: AMP-binding protein [Solirubrobacteraceae bacterium]|nr:AMP-binding protein [Solirubrobacteraceae bacterium]
MTAWRGPPRIGVGDVVAAYLPNSIEAVVAHPACARVGATLTSCSPDLEAGAGDRPVRTALPPALIIAADGYTFARRPRDRRAAVAEPAGAIDGLRGIVLVPRLGLDGLDRLATERWADLCARPAPLELEQVPFDHPLCVLFSSGTAGAPKGIVHGHGGQPLDRVRYHALHRPEPPEDRSFWYTTTSWMIWNWLLAGLLVGSTIVVYDGSPRHPSLAAQFALAEAAGVTVLGNSASYLTGCAKSGFAPGRERELGRLRTVASTVPPLPPATFEWLHDAVGIWTVSASGGTDICSAFVSAPRCVRLDVPRRRATRRLGRAARRWSARSSGGPTRRSTVTASASARRRSMRRSTSSRGSRTAWSSASSSPTAATGCRCSSRSSPGPAWTTTS